MSERKTKISLEFESGFDEKTSKAIFRLINALEKHYPELLHHDEDNLCSLKFLALIPEQVELLKAQGFHAGGMLQCGYRNDGSKVAFLSLNPKISEPELHSEIIKAILQTKQFSDNRFPLLDIQQPLLSPTDFVAANLCTDVENKVMIASILTDLRDKDVQHFGLSYEFFKQLDPEFMAQFENAQNKLSKPQAHAVGTWLCLGDPILRTDVTFQALTYYNQLREHLLENGMDYKPYIEAEFNPKDFFEKSPLNIPALDLEKFDDQDLLFTGIDFKALGEHGDFGHFYSAHKDFTNRNAQSDATALISKTGAKPSFSGPRPVSRFDKPTN